MSIPNSPIVNLGDLYAQGGRLAYATTTTFTVTAGQFRDSTNTNDITLPASTVSIAHTGLNGLDTGTVAASTVYYVYAIGSSIYGNTSTQSAIGGTGTGVATTASYAPAGILLSTALPSVGPSLPVNYDMWRRIGAIRTTAGSIIEPFVQTGFGQNRTMRYMTPVAPVGGIVAPSQAYTTIGALVTVIPQVAMDVIINASLVVTNAGDAVFFAPYGNTAAPGGYMVKVIGGAVDATPFDVQVVCPCAFNAAATPVVEVDYATTAAAGDAVAFTITGYVDVI